MKKISQSARALKSCYSKPTLCVSFLQHSKQKTSFDRLIHAGSNLEIRNARQWTPLDCAAAYGWEKVAHALLEAGASIQPKGKGKVDKKQY